MKLYRVAVGLLVLMACSSIFASLSGIVLHGLSFSVAVVSLCVGAGAGFLAFRHVKEPPRASPLTWLDWLACLLFTVVALRAFLWIAFADGDRFMVLSPNNLGDLTKHWNYIRYMASGCSFWPDNPLLTGSTIRYPIGLDLFNSLLVVCGVDSLRSLVWVGLAGCFLTGFGLFQWGRAFALTGFLCNGGLAGFHFFLTLEFKDYQADMAWKNVFLSMMVTQRGFLFCLPAGLLLFDSWRKRWHGQQAPLPIWVEVVLYSSMPLFHFHTFMFLSMLLGCWAVFGPNPIRRHALKLDFISFIPASVLVLLVTEFFNGPSFFKLQPGWMQNGEPLLQFWIGNFGVLIPLCLVLCAVLLKKRDDPTAVAFVLPACMMFALCCFFLFAPWDWDNTKLMLWAYLAVLPFLWQHLVEPVPIAARICLCAMLFFSGFVSLIGGLGGAGYELARRSELDALDPCLGRIPVTARFAAAPNYNHPLLLMGRKVAMAYPGYMFGHGLPYDAQENNLTALMLGDPGWRKAAKQLQATHLYWGEREEEFYPDSTRPWASTCPVVASGSWGTLYQLVP